MEHCGPGSHMPPEAWCGNAAWFPGYPAAIRGFAWLTRLPVEAVGVLLSAACTLALLFLVQSMVTRDEAGRIGPVHQGLVLFLAAFFPGCIYYVALFPISLFLCGALVFLRACATRRYLVAFVAGAVCGVTYSTGFLLALVPLAAAILERRRQAWDVRVLLAAAGPAAGLAAVFFLQRYQTGTWDAYARIQANYAYDAPAFLDTLLSRLKPLVNPRYRSFATATTATQTLLVLALIAAAVAGWLRTPREERSPLTNLTGIYLVLYWAFPLCVGGRISLYRAESLLLPAVLLTTSWPGRRLAAAVCAAIAISLPMSWLFFRSILV